MKTIVTTEITDIKSLKPGAFFLSGRNASDMRYGYKAISSDQLQPGSICLEFDISENTLNSIDLRTPYSDQPVIDLSNHAEFILDCKAKHIEPFIEPGLSNYLGCVVQNKDGLYFIVKEWNRLAFLHIETGVLHPISDIEINYIFTRWKIKVQGADEDQPLIVYDRAVSAGNAIKLVG